MNFILVVYLVSLFAQLCNFSKLIELVAMYAVAYNLMWGNSVGSSCICLWFCISVTWIHKATQLPTCLANAYITLHTWGIKGTCTCMHAENITAFLYTLQ